VLFELHVTSVDNKKWVVERRYSSLLELNEIISKLDEIINLQAPLQDFPSKKL
jgi:hypothetical protein